MTYQKMLENINQEMLKVVEDFFKPDRSINERFHAGRHKGSHHPQVKRRKRK